MATARRGKRRPGIGRAYYVAGRRLAVALELDGCIALVHWHDGVLCVKPVVGKLQAPAVTPTFLELLADWGIECEDLDAFLEARVYSTHPECLAVRGHRHSTGTGLKHRIGPGEARGRYLGDG